MEPERAYLEGVAERLREILEENLIGVYAGGSWALGGYEAGRSDLDVAAVVRNPLSDSTAAEIVARLRHEALPSPARGLELVVYTVEAVGAPGTAAAFELNLNTGAGLDFRADRTPQPGERHWFAIDRSILAQHGIAILGPPAGEVFVPLPPTELRSVLAEVLHWYARNDPESTNAVLNAGRSLRFARTGVWHPKPVLRDWAAAQAGSNAEILARAIRELETA